MAKPSKQTQRSNNRTAPGRLETQTDLSHNAIPELAESINRLAADSFALYLKTKNFHWHVSGPHFRDYHLLLDEHADQIFATIDELTERVRKLGATTLHSVGEVARLQTIKDNNERVVLPGDMLRELMEDNKKMIRAMRKTHQLCEKHDDVATASILETFIDGAERRNWFLFEASRRMDDSGH